MLGKYASLIVGALLALANTACDTCHTCKKFQTSTDLTLEQIDRSMKEPREHLTNMADNAMLHDMSVADIHFVPHSAELSGTGAARLNRMATLLDAYGGTVRYETFITDEALVKQRLDNVREYLALTGCEMDRVSIKTMMSGGRGMMATKAIKVDAKGTAKDTGKGGSAPAGAPGMVGQP
jgi:hypothetical protein